MPKIINDFSEKRARLDMVGQLKKILDSYLRGSKVLTDKQKDDLLEEMGSNFYDDRFDVPKNFIKVATEWSVHSWQRQNFKLLELWVDIVKANAAVSNAPHKVADEVVKKYKENFDIK